MQQRLVAAVAVAATLLLAPFSGTAAGSPGPPTAPGQALFEGHVIDLSKGWGGAHACLVARSLGIAECFSDQSGLVARESQLAQQQVVDPAIAASTCSTPLRLYADTSYGGRELDFYDRGYWQNLSDWSFDNQTSSYKIGACGADLADGANGGTPWYPGNTSAGYSAPSMASGWNDRISSIYIQ